MRLSNTGTYGGAIVALALMCAALAAASSVRGQPPGAVPSSGGALLYETHCIACHSKEIHWRDRKLATDWTSLAAQVRRWQQNTGLQWSDDEIEQVTRYLNRTIYRFPDQASRQIG
jgi:mono/diheme cytochrome c family protein